MTQSPHDTILKINKRKMQISEAQRGERRLLSNCKQKGCSLMVERLETRAMLAITYDMLPISDAGNASDATGYGNVPYSYQIGKFEVTLGQYTVFLNAVAATDTYALYNTVMAIDKNSAGIARNGASGSYTYSVIGPFGSAPYGADSVVNRPVTYVNWFDAARFANWMSNGQPTGPQSGSTTENGAYALNGAMAGTAPAVNSTNPNTGLAPLYRLSTENEWYKAAYYKAGGSSAGYWSYATRSDMAPGNAIGSAVNQANYRLIGPTGFISSVTQSTTPSLSQNYLTNVGAFSGSPSSYGTFDQAGNVWEWNDLAGLSGTTRGVRGGGWDLSGSGFYISSGNRGESDPTVEGSNRGFRLAAPIGSTPPTDILLSVSAIAENNGTNAVVGTFTTVSKEVGNTFSYTLVAGSGSEDNAAFSIFGSELRATASLDFETKALYTVRVRSTDRGGLFFERSFTIAVLNVNETPSAITLSQTSIAELAGSNALVGTFATTDPDVGNTFTYSLVSGSGSKDNAAFNIEGSKLRATSSLDFETQGSHSVRVRCTDQGGLYFETAFTVVVVDVNDAIAYDLRPIRDVGNTSDATGYGSVSYSYQIGKCEVTIGQYVAFLNAIAKEDLYSLYNPMMASDQNVAGISRAGTSGSYTYRVIEPFGRTTTGADSPGGRAITYISWFDAARFANWMSNGQPVGGQRSSTTEDGAYNVNGRTTGVAPAVNAINPNTGAVPTYRLPTENEWYKAAYYKGGGTNVGYWAYATQSSLAPGNMIGPKANQANYRYGVSGGGTYSVTQLSTVVTTQGYLANAAAYSSSTSAYGTFDQSGGVWEIIDVLGATDANRVMRGGGWLSDSAGISASGRVTGFIVEGSVTGFRLASSVMAFASPATNYDLLQVGDAGNAHDATGYGGVPDTYRIGKYEVTVGQYAAFLNAIARTDTYALYNESMGSSETVSGIARNGRSGSYTYSVIGPAGVTPPGADSGGGRPITFVSWFDAARFANWMSNGQPVGSQGPTTTENGAYALNGLTSGTAPAVNATNPRTGATPLYRIPTEDEWYKAAYYSGHLNSGSGGYYAYATQSNDPPGNVVGDASNQANYRSNRRYAVTQTSYVSGQNYLTSVGAFVNSASSYGTFDQNGNAHEWNDLSGTPSSARGVRGGAWASDFPHLSSSSRAAIDPSGEGSDLGFRLASSVIAPTGIEISKSTISENAGANATIGVLTAIALDSNRAFTHTLVAGEGSTGNAVFSILDNELRAAVSFDYEVKHVYSVRVRSTDQYGLYVERAFAVNVTNVNEPPAVVALSEAAVTENAGTNAVVGALATIDPDANNTFTYMLVAGAGSTDNGSFNVLGNQLRATASLDFESKKSYTVRVRSTDQGGLYTEKAFTISVTNVNETPTGIALAGSTIAENAGANAVFGTLTTTDPDVGNTFTYTLVTGTGSTDNPAFNISGNQLRATASLDFETNNSYSVRVRTTDQGSLSFEKVFTVTVTNVNETPTDIALSGDTVSENAGANAVFGTLTTADPDASNAFTYTLVTGTGSTDNAAFNLSGNQLRATANLDFETKNSYSIRLRSTDQGGLFVEKAFAVVVADVLDEVVLDSSDTSPTTAPSLPPGSLAKLVKRGGGTLILDKPNSHTGGTVVEAGEVIIKNPAALGSGALEVRAGARVTLDVAGSEVAVGALKLAEGGRLDLGYGRVALHVSPGSVQDGLGLARVQDLLRSAYKSNWVGASGFATRTARLLTGGGLGYLDNGGSITVGFAAKGDSNLDGSVDVLDAANFLSSGKMDSWVASIWFDGDFNHDGFVDLLDMADFVSSGLLEAGPYRPVQGSQSDAPAMNLSAFDAAFVALATDVTGSTTPSTTKKVRFASPR